MYKQYHAVGTISEIKYKGIIIVERGNIDTLIS